MLKNSVMVMILLMRKVAAQSSNAATADTTQWRADSTVITADKA